MTCRIFQGDVLDRLRDLPDESVQCVVTSPPYWSLRTYDNARCIGGEDRPEQYVEAMVGVFREARRVLKPRGICWVNLGDSYAASGKGGGGKVGDKRKSGCWKGLTERTGFRMPPPGFKMKDITLAPFAVADALRRDGWYLRSTIIWEKPAAVEPIRLDRPATSHEYIFLLSRSEMYDANQPGEPWWGHSVWKITSEHYGAHPAVMPEELARRCILVGSKEGDTVLDPFSGAGTTGLVAVRMGREYVGIELNPTYAAMSAKRITEDAPMFNRVEVIGSPCADYPSANCAKNSSAPGFGTLITAGP